VTLRTGHGNGAGVPRIEVLPADELPLGVQAPPQARARDERRPDGTFARGARTLQAMGGHAAAGRSKLASRMGLRSLPAGSPFSPYKKSAAAFRRAQCAELARNVGGGRCGPAPSSLVASAALQLAWSRFLGDLAAEQGDADLALKASRLAEASRQSLLAAHELCAKEALARPTSADPLADLRRRMDAVALPPSTPKPKEPSS
jgi:hypothetical protein